MDVTFMFENSIFNLSSCLQDICRLTDMASPFYIFILLSLMQCYELQGGYCRTILMLHCDCTVSSLEFTQVCLQNVF